MRPTKKWERRDKKLHRKKNAMRVSGRSVFLLEKIINEKGAPAKENSESVSTATMTNRSLKRGRIALSDADIRLLRQMIQNGEGNHVEIGMLWGGSAIIAAEAMREYSREGFVYTIDPMNTEYWLNGDPSFGGKKPTLEKVLENFVHEGYQNDIVIAIDKSDPWPISDVDFDTIFIDGDHSKSGLLKDIQKATPASWMLIHDYMHGYNDIDDVIHNLINYSDVWELVDAVHWSALFKKKTLKEL